MDPDTGKRMPLDRRAQGGAPEAALHILNHIVPDIPPGEEDQR